MLKRLRASSLRIVLEHERQRDVQDFAYVEQARRAHTSRRSRIRVPMYLLTALALLGDVDFA
jgi:hypothetical protein